MTIEESVPAQRVVVKIEFVKPMKSVSTSTFTLAPSASGTSVTWAMDGKHNFLGKAMGLFMNMDGMLGSDIEKGLGRVKAAAEGV